MSRRTVLIAMAALMLALGDLVGFMMVEDAT